MKENNSYTLKNFHGVFSISLFIAAMLLGAYSISSYCFTIGVAYLLAIPIGFFGVAGIFCTKCPCAPDNCSHVIIGYLTIPFQKREAGIYKMKDYVFTAGILVLLVGFPQYWLYRDALLFIAFWALMAIAGIEVALFVCKACGNKYCAMCKNKKTM